MPEIIIFSKVQSRQRVSDVKASVALARDLNEIVNGHGADSKKESLGFNQRLTKNLCVDSFTFRASAAALLQNSA